MLALRKRYLLFTSCCAIVFTLLIYAFMPEPIRVDYAVLEKGSLSIAIEAEGKTRIRDTFIISAPVAGRLNRIALKAGDTVRPGMLIAQIDPVPLEPRQREELKAQVSAAEEVYRAALANAELVKENLAQANREYTRAKELAVNGLISQQSLEQADNRVAALKQELSAAQHRVQSALSEISVAKAGLIAYEPIESTVAKKVNIYAPINSTVLNILEKSERVIAAGTSLLELGDTNKIELVIDLLSADAVKVRAGNRVIIKDWGGVQPLQARVRLIEPSAFTKISALGIEEQRVNIIADLIDRPKVFGNGYKFSASIILLEKENVLKLPFSALFRNGNDWHVFLVSKDGRAKLQRVIIGERATVEVEVLQGVTVGDRVILFPTNQLENGARVITD